MGLHQEGVSAVMVSLLSLPGALVYRTKTETLGEAWRLPMFERQKKKHTTGGSFLLMSLKI